MILSPDNRYLPQAKSIYLLKNIGKRVNLPTISPRERTLIIKAPSIYKSQNKSYIEKGEFTQRYQNNDIQKLKELFERVIKKDSPGPATPLPVLNKSPLRNKSTENNKKPSEKIVLTAYKRFQGTKPLITRKKDKNSKPIFSMNSLTVISRSLSKKSFEKSIIQVKEGKEKTRKIVPGGKSRLCQREKEKEKEKWKEIEKDGRSNGLNLIGDTGIGGNSGNAGVSGNAAFVGLVGIAQNAGLVRDVESARSPGFASVGVATRDIGLGLRAREDTGEDRGRGKRELFSESDEDRMEIYEDFQYV